ncbi:hypothetical protein MSPP1_000874 [Malassezia sp. CBS 17886]|nr:hypothetical protein MSPP1_000874 [Malassezia sp. CBS 17886]
MDGRRGVVALYLDEFQQAARSFDGAGMLACVALAPPAHMALHSALQTEDPEILCDGLHLAPAAAGALQKRLASLLADYLGYIKGTPMSAPGAYDAWVKVFSCCSMIISLPDTVWFVAVLVYAARRLVSLAIDADQRSATRVYTKTIDAAGRLSKCAGLVANDRTAAPGAETKRVAVLALANLSFRAYFKLNNTRLCETVLGSVHNALLMNRRNSGTPDATGEECYSLAERVTYRYHLGQVRLIQHVIDEAAKHLRWAFDHCPTAHTHNKRLIAAPLIATYMILGRYAAPALLQQLALTDEFGALLHYHRLGYGAGVLAELERQREWLRTKGLYMILCEKAMLGVWRNLFRRCLLLQHSTPLSTTAPPTLPLARLVLPVQLAWGDPSLTLDDLECMAANLIDQDLMKAYILHSKRLVVLQKGPHRGFPAVASVYLR